MQLILHCLRIQFNYEKCWIVRCHGNDGITMVHSQDQLPQSNDLDFIIFAIQFYIFFIIYLYLFFIILLIAFHFFIFYYLFHEQT